jgi:hypothetical protein
MKKIVITQYTSPDKTSSISTNRKYSVMCDFGNRTFYFDTKRELEDFLIRFSQDLTDLLFLYNESLSRAFVAYRSLWFYMDEMEKEEVFLNHECDKVIVSLTRLFDRIVHWDFGGDAYHITGDLKLIGTELQGFWSLLVLVTANRNQWADNYRFKLEVSLVDNFREKLASITTPASIKETAISYDEMTTAKELLNHPVDLRSKTERQRFASGLVRLRKQSKN